jgi:predicted RNase H-like HicB family nuclease
MVTYPVTLEADDDGTVIVTFLDMPGVIHGADRDEALGHAVEVLEVATAMSVGAEPPPKRIAKGRRQSPSAARPRPRWRSIAPCARPASTRPSSRAVWA